MKRQIRKNAFETNSSSVHTITISKNGYNKSIIPESLAFTFGEFGWEVDKLCSVQSKASYLYTALNDQTNRDKYIETIKNVLKSVGCVAAFEEKSERSYWENGYIDHSEYLGHFLTKVFESEDSLLRYLFGTGCIYTYNDNRSYEDLPFYDELNLDAGYDIIRKGN